MFPLSRRIALASALAAALSLPVLAQTAPSSPSPFPAAAPAAGPGFGARAQAPERIDRMRALRQQRNAEMDRRGDATKALYAALSPEQQQRMDAWGPRPGDGRGRHGRHHGGRMMD